MQERLSRRRAVWLLLSAAAVVLGTAWVLRFMYVRGDVGAGCSFEVFATTSKDSERPKMQCHLSVNGSRQTNGWTWSETITVRATLWPRKVSPLPDEGLLIDGPVWAALPVSEVTGMEDGRAENMMGWVVATTVQPEDVMAAVRAGGTLTRTYEGQTTLLARAGAGLLLGAAGLFGVVHCLWLSFRDERRKARWLCIACAYPLVNGKCPECGKGGAA